MSFARCVRIELSVESENGYQMNSRHLVRRVRHILRARLRDTRSGQLLSFSRCLPARVKNSRSCMPNLAQILSAVPPSLARFCPMKMIISRAVDRALRGLPYVTRPPLCKVYPIRRLFRLFTEISPDLRGDTIGNSSTSWIGDGGESAVYTISGNDRETTHVHVVAGEDTDVHSHFV